MSDSEEYATKRKIISILYGILAALGISLYVGWSIMYGTWFDVGLYSISALMIGFGLIGFFLYSIKEEKD